MPTVFEDFGQCDVVSGTRAWSGAHRDAETGVARLTAVDGNDERAFTSRNVGRILVVAAHENAILNADSVEVTGAHADEGVARSVHFVVDLE